MGRSKLRFYCILFDLFVLGASRARALSTFMDIAPIDCPKANSTFVVDKKLMLNVDECLSPEMFSPVKAINEKSTNPNTTYNKPTNSVNTAKNSSKKIDIIPVQNNSAKKIDSKKKR